MSTAVTSDGWTVLTRPLERALGKRTANALAKLDLHTVGDLIYHFPFRLAHRGELMPIAAVREGEPVTVIARVIGTNLRPMNARRGYILQVRITDGTHDLALTFFGKSSRPLQYHERRLQVGTVATFSGTISSYRGQLQLTHPEYELVDDEPDLARLERPIPIYHAAERVPSWQVEKAIATILPSITPADLPDPLPSDYRQQHGLPARYDAVRTLHMPDDDASWKQASLRMAHEEAFVLQANLARRAVAAKDRATAAFSPHTGGILEAFDARLPYRLTAGQRAVGEEIAAELATTTPMQRLLQGDVGSGKTVVALRAMLQVVDGGGQAALLAPTEVLAWQHLRTIEDLLGPLGLAGQLGGAETATRVEILTGSLTTRQRRQALARIASGEAGLIVGTHALLSEDVQIPFLGLAVVDEQHRFGVDQRDRLAGGVHTLVMTATPIPRTIAMSVFGDLDVSTLRELPAGRKSVATTVVPATNERWMARVWERAREEVDGGGRVYVVCPRIDGEENPDEDLASVLDVAEELRARPILNGIAIGVMHGRLSTEEKTAAMAEFAGGNTPILVSTTVIEVGVDVPEATLMVILDADRFGLSQLHQLRGRIGRGGKEGTCLAVSRAIAGTLAAERLAVFASTTDGFELAERDLQLRSEGDVLGTSQSGRASHLRFLSVVRDVELIAQARDAARTLVASDPTLADHPELAVAVAELDEGRADYLEKG